MKTVLTTLESPPCIGRLRRAKKGLKATLSKKH